ncbi:CYTH domain-containing protein [Microbacterium sp. NPDC057407]|uniref:CYTH domain-containing protein n=1 Tax=Microbacterium sp. NPDC057407 TaxID=3346120 RepID=UPI00366C3090
MAIARLHGGPLDGQLLPLEDPQLDRLIVPYSETQVVYERKGDLEKTGRATARPRPNSGSSSRKTPSTRTPAPRVSSAESGADGAPSRSVEVELKFDVDEGTPLPDLSPLPGVAGVTAAEERSLDALYLDTTDRTLAQNGYALRRRTGGPDAGWHIKGPRGADGGRVELHWPLGEADAVPAAALAELGPIIGDELLAPLARIRNRRVPYLLLDAAGGVLAELADDHVATTDEREGTLREWREWEIELASAAPADPAWRSEFFDAVARVVHAAGGRAAASDSKLARALGH